MFRRERDLVTPAALVAGVTFGSAAMAYGVLRLIRRRRAALPAGASPLDQLEHEAVEALRRDPQTGVSAIDVAALAPGIVELTGMVPTHEAGQRAARLLHSLPGVRTVINRLDMGSVEERLAENRARRSRGEGAASERQWYGVRVGTGRRRQSLETDPARPDDTVPRRMRELEVSAADLAADAPPVDLSGQGQGS